jgi:hypothetical protein
MAFTETQRVAIRGYLGAPDVFRDHDTRLESALTVIGERPEAQAAVEAIMVQIVAASTEVTNAMTTAGLKRAEDLEWYQAGSGGSELETKRSIGRMHIGRLSRMLGVELRGDYFGPDGYAGDGWASLGSQYGGMISMG